jgi:hypothetical protein
MNNAAIADANDWLELDMPKLTPRPQIGRGAFGAFLTTKQR